jgi:hypothetical protein
MSAGQLITGTPLSCTVTLKLQVLLLLLASVAVHNTVVAPIGNVLPEGGTQTTVGRVSTRSEAVGVA